MNIEHLPFNFIDEVPLILWQSQTTLIEMK